MTTHPPRPDRSAAPPLQTGRRNEPLSGLVRRQGHQWRVFALIALLVLSCTYWLAGDLGRSQTYTQLDERLDSLASSQVGVIESIRSKYGILPAVLAQDESLWHALESRIPATEAALSRKLASLARSTGASVFYLINADGHTVAASNWDQPDSFVGSDYSFRPYFREAMRTGKGEYFALGTASHKPGLYFSHRIENAAGTQLGVIVVKLEFDALEQEWQRYPDILFVTDADGVVILASIPAWRLATLTPLAPERSAALLQSLQFGPKPLQPLPLQALPPDQTVRWQQGDEQYLASTQAIPDSTWTLHALSPTRDALLRSTAASRLTAMLGVAALLALVAIFMQRRHLAHERTARQGALQRQLEQTVADRTAALQQSNLRLEREMRELEQSRARARELREQLEQANKLSFLGQIAAGVAHEINQPVAAIRAYADNTRAYLARGDNAAVDRNLAAMDGLTHRIGAITAQLCNYARKPAEESTSINVHTALDNALLLLAHRLRRQQDAIIDTQGVDPDLHVQAAQVRLEQVFVNLIRNALDAMEGRPDARITIRARIEHGLAVIHVSDNGPGILPAMRARLFTPFASSRADGLGLGLLISHDIIAAFDGRLEEISAPGEGAHFVITLPSGSRQP